MGGINSVTIAALKKDDVNLHQIDLFTYWTFDAGKMAKIRNVNDDLANNRVDVEFDILVGTPQVTRKLTRIILQNPYSELDANHQIRVFAYETGQTTLEDDMDTGNAYGN